MTEKEASELLRKWKEGKCSPDELAILERWFDDLDVYAPATLTETEYDLVQSRIWGRLNAHQPTHMMNRKPKLFYWEFAAAAAVFILVSSIAYFFFRQDGNADHRSEIVSVPHDIPAGTNKATLTLANGQQILLDDANTGAIANQAGVTVTKNISGQIVYDASSPSPSGPDAFNTISTPNGGQYQIILPDGSKVWLNAASSLKYPVRFVGNQRKVTLTGEAYFEISKNPKKPFFVSSTDQTIRVLGTHFNLSSYANEPVKTTLAEGKIEISQPSSPQKTILLQGDESIITRTGLSVRKVDPEDAIAWKDGLFIFSSTDLKDVMRQISRWYDVEVEYSAIPNMKYEGEIPRDIPLLQVLQLIERGSKVSLTLEGRRIIGK